MKRILPVLQLKTTTLLFIICSIVACKKYEDVQISDYQPEFAIPLLQTSLSIEDVLNRFDEDTFVTIDEDGFVTMNYKGDITARSSTDIFDFIAQTEGVFPLFDTATALPFGTPNGFDMDYAIIDDGKVQFLYINDIPEPMDMTIQIPNLLTPDGEVFEFKQYHPVGSVIPFQSDSILLKDHILKPTNDSIYVKYFATLQSTGERKELSSIGLNLWDFTASYVEGYMGNDIYEIPRDTIEIDFFENWTQGEVYFEDPKISVSVINSFGFPVRSKANIMDVFTADGRVLTLQSLYVDSINVDYPRLDEVGETRTTLFYFDNENSNIAELLGSNPVALDYEMKALANPDMDTTIRGFMTDTSQFKIQVEVELPMHGRALGFAARDTLAVDFSEFENVIAAELKLIADNSLPLQVGLQGYLLDENNKVLDSLFLQEMPVIAPAPVDDDGLVTGLESLTNFIPLDAERFDKLRPTKNIAIVTSFSTFNEGQTPVKIFNNQFVEVRMGMKVSIEQ